jgi:HD superfamily phosphohydrolase
MRVLYPSARHDRFIHSLGTFHLGSIAFDALEHNVKNRPDNQLNFDDAQWQIWRHTFRIACLLHDCGHSPFSHTFEEYYDRNPLIKLSTILAKAANKENDQSAISTLPTTPHEIISAIFVLNNFKDAISKVDSKIDPVLVARMITGWDYPQKNTNEQKIESCLIRLLNGRAIDVDKLDYIIRDTWASGCDNTAIDIQRLLNAVSIGTFDDGLVLSFEKSALSVIESVVNARNYLYRWIYSHHKVVYDTWLLERAVKSLYEEFQFKKGTDDDKKKRDTEKDEFLSNLFSIEAIESPKTIDDRTLYLLSDGDIIHYLKKWASLRPESEAYEWISRKHVRKTLWKSYAEYCQIFPRIATEDTTENQKFSKTFKDLLNRWEQDNSINLGTEILEAYPKQVTIDSASVYINMPTGTVSYSEIQKKSIEKVVAMPKFFYAYIKREHYETYAKNIIKFVKENM